MSLSQAGALGQVDLEPGRVYRWRVKGRWVELRVLEAVHGSPSTRFDESESGREGAAI